MATSALCTFASPFSTSPQVQQSRSFTHSTFRQTSEQMHSLYHQFHTNENKIIFGCVTQALPNTSFELRQLPQKTTPRPYQSAALHAARTAPAATAAKKEKGERKKGVCTFKVAMYKVRGNILEDCHRSFPKHLYTKINTYCMTQF